MTVQNAVLDLHFYCTRNQPYTTRRELLAGTTALNFSCQATQSYHAASGMIIFAIQSPFVGMIRECV